MTGRLLIGGLTAVYAVLWIGGVASHALLPAPPAAAAWAGPAFLACAAAIVIAGATGARAWVAAAGVAGFGFEVLGVHTGFPFGTYAYTPVLQPHAFGVPVVLGCAWAALMAYTRDGIALLKLPRWAGVAVGAAWMVAIDLVIDPVAAGLLDYWRWPQGGIYYGIPATNFAGWLLVSAVLHSVAPTRPPGRFARAAGVSIVVFFALIAASGGLLWPALIGWTLVLADWVAGGIASQKRWSRPARQDRPAGRTPALGPEPRE